MCIEVYDSLQRNKGSIMLKIYAKNVMRNLLDNDIILFDILRHKTYI